MIQAVVNHLWQSTVFAALAGAIALALRKHHAGARYWVWMAASVKFLVPFALLSGIGSHAPAVVMRQAVAMTGTVRAAAATVVEYSEPFPTTASRWPDVLAAIWACGVIVVAVWWAREWRRARRSPAAAPGVFGIVRPRLAMPEGIEERLTAEQLRAVVAHEMAHVRRRDNLLATIHMTVEALFWFHPLVWWIGARLMEERERACDEEVLREGADPHAYASGILEVCKWYLETRVECVAGVTGADLKRRIAGIVSGLESKRLSWAQKVALAAAVAVCVAAPVAIGVLRAQGATKFAVASIKRADPNQEGGSYRLMPGGGLRVSNMTLKQVVLTAYDLRDMQLIGAPSWLDAERYDIQAKLEQPEGPADLRSMTLEQGRRVEELTRERTQALLAERFHFAAHREKRELPVFALTQAKSGHKMHPSQADDSEPRHLRTRIGGSNGVMKGNLDGKKTTMEMLAKALTGPLNGLVIDATGLDGAFDFSIEWTPDSGAAPASGDVDNAPPSLVTALTEQLGLKIERKKAPVDVLVIDRVERPTEN